MVASRSGPAFRAIVAGASAGGFHAHFGFTPVPDRPERMVLQLRRVADALGMNTWARE